MKSRFAVLLFLISLFSNAMGQVSTIGKSLTAASSNIPGDNTMRYYRLAIPVTYSAYVEDLDENYNNVLQFWRDCEEFANRMFVPLGICFNVIEDQRLIKSDYFPNEDGESFIYTLQSNGTSNTNDLIGEDSYDVGMWVHHRGVELDNSGLSAEGGVYSDIAKGSGYSKTDKWVVAHELGHMFGAPHTTTGEGSLMDSGGDDFFSYPSIKKIRDLAVGNGAGSANNAIKVSNNAPVFNNANMKDSYRIPQGACIAIPVYANDADGNILTYSAIGCSSSTVGNIVEGGVMPHFASVVPQTDNVIDYRPKFTADIVYDDFYYEQDGTNIPAMNAGSYNIAILVNDVPASMEYDYLTANPFYSNYAVWDATVQIVGGTSFNASMSPAKNSYSAGEQVTVSWGVNSNYFTADSRLRITMSTDYGKTFAYVLADDVPALDGSKAVTLPNVNVGNIDVDFKTATRSMRGGIIRVEEIGGVAYTLTTLSPTDGKGFNITGGSGAPITYTISVTAGDGGTATIDGKSSTTVVAGSSVTLTATPNDGYIFDAWYSGGKFVSSEAEYTFTPTASGTYNALFEKEAGTPVTYKITATANPIEGGTATVNGGTSATVEANGTIELSAKANDGYTFVNWTSGGKEVTTQADCTINNITADADYVANFEEEATPTEYPTPTGNTYTDNYLTSITTTGGDTNIDYSANAHPGQKLVDVPGKVQLEKGKSFTMNLVAYSLGAGSNSTIREDMRYCHASLFTDFDQDFTFEASPVQYWGNQPPTNNVYGNYDYVMNITHTITVPDDAPTGESHIRMIYTNAWNGRPANGTAVLDKGIVYDIVVEVVEKVDITANAGEGGSVTINGEATGTKRVIKGSSVTLNATPASGYSFLNWSNTEGIVSETAEYTFTANSATTLTANFEQEVQDVLTTGYYHLVSRATDRNEHLYNNAFSSDNTNHFTLQSNTMVNTNNGIWYITKNGNQLGIKNGDGKPVVAGNSNNESILGTFSNLNIHTTINDANDGYTYYYFNEAINCSKSDQNHFKVGGINYLTTWSGHPEAADNQWRFERVDTEGKNIYNVVVECTDKDVYVTYGSEYAFNGGFFITNETITAQQLTAKKNNADAEGVTVLVEGNTIRVVDAEYVEIAVSATPAEGGSITINGEAESTLQVVKSSNVIVVATPADGYHFVNWTDAGSNAVSTDATYTFTASESTSLTANFEADVVYHTITVSTFYDNNGGTVKVGEEDATSVNVTEGESVRMLATVKEGYEFMGWLKDGVIVKNAIDGGLDFEVQGPDYTLYEIKASAEYVAVFSKITDYTNLEDGKAYRIRAVSESCAPRYIYREGTELKWTNDDSNFDDNYIFVVQKNGNSINLISAIGYHGWKASNILGNDEQYNHYAAIKVTYGTKDETRSLYLESGTSSGIYTTLPDYEFEFTYTPSKSSLPIKDADNSTTDFLFEEVDTYAFQVSAADGSNAKLGTINLPFATTVPEGVTAYSVDHSEDENVYMAELELTDNVLPANTPVLVEAEAAGKYGFKPAPASKETYNTGFAGTLEAEDIPGTTNAYILSYKGAGTHIMLYKLSSTSRRINANKAYFIDKTGKASALRFVLGGTTDIEEVKGENGEVEAIYDLQGRKLSEITEPGMYIINGKKVYKK
ncbi:MAG: InlB B-repeat-containing protein [Bacteroidaceae bacterium]|nr:InlB B-repeat-containing protein [Bacteroidaceae bacterium]